MPCLATPVGYGIDASVVEDLPYGRWCDLVSEAGQLAMDAPVSPGWVVARHFHHQRADILRGRWTSWTPVWVVPAALDDGDVPAQQGTRRDDQAKLAAEPLGELPGQRGQDRAVGGPGQPWCFDAALEHCDLAQDQDLGIFGQI